MKLAQPLRIVAIFCATALLAACGGAGDSRPAQLSSAELSITSGSVGVNAATELPNIAMAGPTKRPLDLGTAAVGTLAVGATALRGADFNGDGKSDILFRQASTGRVIMYLLSGGTVLSTVDLGGNTDWSAVGTGDFNADGRSDILWRQVSTGTVRMHLMNGGSVLSGIDLGGNTDWTVAAVADFNGDGKSDILFRQASTGNVRMNLLNGGVVLNSINLGGNTDWSAVAAGDFNGDGKSDILWRQLSTGQVLMYLMDGGTILNAFGLGGNLDWSIASTADFNGDGKSDIIWRQVSTGKALLHLRDGSAILNAFDLGGNTDWSVALAGDFNGDGNSDILWRQASTGNVLMNLMSSSTVLGQTNLGGNSDWGIAAAPTPAIDLSSSSVAFVAIVGGADPVGQSITISNGGGGTLSGLTLGAVAYGPGATAWLQPPTLSSGTAPATLTLQAVAGSLPIGTYTATVPLRSEAANNSPQSLAVTFTVTRPNTLAGSAAAGGSIVGTVTVKDSSQPVKQKVVTIAADGQYAIDVSGLTAPFMLRADGTAGGRSYGIYSAAIQADVGGAVNVTPLTDLIVANAAGQIAAAIYQSGNFSVLTSASLNAAEAALQARLQPVLAAVGVNTIDLLRTPFSADGTGIDAALGILRVTVDVAAARATITNAINNQQIVDDLAIQSDATALTDAGGVATGLTTLQSGCDVLAFQPPELKPICPDSLPGSGLVFEIGLDGRSRVAKLTNDLTGNVTIFGYGSTNQLTTVVTHDSAGALLATTNFEIGLDGRGRVATQTNARTGNVTSFSYGSTNQVSGVVTHDSAGTLLVTTSFEIGLDGKGRVAQQTNARTGNVTSFGYGSTNQLATVVTRDSAGTPLVTTSFEIGLTLAARVAQQTDARTGNVTSSSYGSTNQLVEEVTHDSGGILLVTTSFENGPSGARVRTVNDHQTGRLSTYVYDAKNRATVSW